ncbi:MAG TPA: hypothetical protein VOA87_14975, partial [Thermoanaerobaculia bacterium]|nr:hypothetical protein [Thermoanaerobaculia bacterium]
MPALPFKLRHLKRYQEISRLLRFVRPELWQGSGLEGDGLEAGEEQGQAANAEQLAAELEQLGPTFIK